MKLGDYPLKDIVSPERLLETFKTGTWNVRTPDHGNIVDRVKEKTLSEINLRLEKLHVTNCGYQHDEKLTDSAACPLRPGNLACGHSDAFSEKKGGALQSIENGIVSAELLGVLPEECKGTVQEHHGRKFVSLEDLSAICNMDLAVGFNFAYIYGKSGSTPPSNAPFFKHIDHLIRKIKAKKYRRSLQQFQGSHGGKLINIRDSLVEVLSPLLDIEIERK